MSGMVDSASLSQTEAPRRSPIRLLHDELRLSCVTPDFSKVQSLLSSASPHHAPQALVDVLLEKDLSTEFHDNCFTAAARSNSFDILSLFVNFLNEHELATAAVQSGGSSAGGAPTPPAGRGRLLDTPIKEGRTALFVCASAGWEKCLRLLLENGACTAIRRSTDGATPIFNGKGCGGLFCCRTLYWAATVPV